jgi:Hypothetical glycosyl hydrolase family 15
MLHHPIRRLIEAFAAVAALALSAGAFAFTPPPFPRIGGIQIGGSKDYNDPTYQAELARQSVMVLGYAPGYRPGGESMATVVQQIKAINPDALVFLYTDIDALTPAGTDAESPLRDKINAMNWWLSDGSSAATTTLADVVPSFYGHGEDTINNSPYTPKDSSGYDSIDWITRWYVSNYYTPNPDIDGLFQDNVFVRPRVAGDWYEDGVVLASSDPKAAAALQAGYERWFQLARQLMPGKYQIGNIGSWASYGVPAGYEGMADGGEIEALIGKSYSIETWGGWQAMENEYYTIMSAVNSPKLVIFNQWGDPTDYQSMRYGLASCLMNDGYYSFTSLSGGYSGVVWFDEYNANLGDSTGAPPTGAWQKGVWRRDFTNGIALVNPKGNGPQTVTLETPFVKLSGTQDPAVNNGATVTQVTLQDRDGIILLRKAPLEKPDPPTDVTGGTG